MPLADFIGLEPNREKSVRLNCGAPPSHSDLLCKHKCRPSGARFPSGGSINAEILVCLLAFVVMALAAAKV